MARVLFFALLAMCLVCLIQGAPAGEQPAASGAGNPVEEIIRGTEAFGETIKTTAEKVVADWNSNPHVQQMMESGKKLAKEFASHVQTGIEAVIPKTE